MRRSLGTIVMVVLFVLGTVFVLTQLDVRVGGGSTAANAFVPPPGSKARPLGEISPNGDSYTCWRSGNKPSIEDKTRFTRSDGPVQAGKWLGVPVNATAAERYHSRLNDPQYRDFYLVNEVVTEWDSMSKVDRVANYVSQLVATQLPYDIHVQNTWCSPEGIRVWQDQTLPKGTWIGFVPGHELESKDPRPVIKLDCGNLLGPAVRASSTPSPKASTTTPQASPSTTPPPSCERGCTTTPPPGGKKPNEGSGPKGNAPEGSGRNENPGPGAAKPYNPPPSKAYTPPAPPPAKPPTGTKPTEHNPPPPEPSLKPTGGAPNTGMPPPPNW